VSSAAAGAAEADAVVNRTVSPSMANVLKHMRGWRGHNNPWMAEGDEGEQQGGIDAACVCVL
jgi:hypothetical protein